MSNILCNLIKNGGGGSTFEYPYLGETLTVTLSGSTSISNYPVKIVYISQDFKTVYLLGTAWAGTLDHSAAVSARWTAQFLYKNVSYTVQNITIPTLDQIKNCCAGYYIGLQYWLSTTITSSTSMEVNAYGWVSTASNTTKMANVPYFSIEI